MLSQVDLMIVLLMICLFGYGYKKGIVRLAAPAISYIAAFILHKPISNILNIWLLNPLMNFYTTRMKATDISHQLSLLPCFSNVAENSIKELSSAISMMTIRVIAIFMISFIIRQILKILGIMNHLPLIGKLSRLSGGICMVVIFMGGMWIFAKCCILITTILPLGTFPIMKTIATLAENSTCLRLILNH